MRPQGDTVGNLFQLSFSSPELSGQSGRGLEMQPLSRGASPNPVHSSDLSGKQNPSTSRFGDSRETMSNRS